MGCHIEWMTWGWLDQDAIALPDGFIPVSRIAWVESHSLPSSCRKSAQALQQGFPRLTGTAPRGGQGVGVFSEM